MRELSVPSLAPDPSECSVADYVYDNAARDPQRTALRRRNADQWSDVSAGTFAAEVTELARGLIGAGLQRGDRIALMSKTRYEWTLVDFAALAIGAVVVPIYETSSAEQVGWILSDSGAVAMVVETPEHQAIVQEVRANTPELRHLWQIEAGAVATIGALGELVDAADVGTRRQGTRIDDLASIIYTSGTTGRPKGCELSHRNFITEVSEVTTGLHQLFAEGTSTLLFLPIAHVFGRAIEIGALATGCVLGHTADIRNLLDDLKGFQPTFVLSVPRVFEKVYNTARQRAHTDGKERIFDLAERAAIRYSVGLESGSIPKRVKLQHAIFDRLVYGKLRAALGGRCDAAVSGGAPLGARLGHFFRGVGITIYEGYGLTETTAGVCVNRPDAIRVGSVGMPVGGTTARVGDDGELLLRGPLVFQGYWRNDEATKQAIDADGWFHTGDIGEIDAAGYVTITGRKKEIIVTAAGKNVAPAVLEDRVRAHWLVSQCLVVGDRQPFIAALITVDPEAFPTWLKDVGRDGSTDLSAVLDDPGLRGEFQSAIDEANKAVSKAEAIRKFIVLPHDWTEATGELTPSLKLKRNVVQAACADEIAALYASGRPADSA
ncbi:MAG: AMP-dependent synthetase/ligase [Actinomycetota bacterium]